MGKLDWSKTSCAAVLLCATTAIALRAQTFTTLHSFDSTDGRDPAAGLVQGTDGNLYGTTDFGGANNVCRLGCGTVFRIGPSGTLIRLHSFCSRSNCADGYQPNAGLVQATDGNFYGMTQFAGTNTACNFGCGTIFKITPTGTLTTLYTFCSRSACSDGASPVAGLIQATDGNLYGTTLTGGMHGGGAVFRITLSGTVSRLYSFCSQANCADGLYPYAPLIQATDGNFYGTTTQGGGPSNFGEIFKITPSGRLTVLHSFNGTDGGVPYAGLIQGSDGALYGTGYAGGSGENSGTVFKITLAGTLTTVHSFNVTGESPNGLVQATDGNFYGTTQFGGTGTACTPGCGTLFKMTASGTLTTLYNLCSLADCVDGAIPRAGPIQDTNGRFYGTAGAGGTSNVCRGGCGTVFSVSVGLGPFVKTQPTSGKPGQLVKILGTTLTGSKLVTFNGTAAVFKVISSSLITATVPSGATTGEVRVTTPSRTLSSNVPFRVLP